MATRKPVRSLTKSVAPGIFNILPGPRYVTETVWSDGKKTKGYGYSKSESEKDSLRKG